ncbi:MAG TPA: NfeD family protein [Gammaproteobacteria bacterium]|nr:NfeD family protein [Gammaproteobacteria bacterium]
MMEFFNAIWLNNFWVWYSLALLLVIFEVMLGANFFLLWLSGVAAVVGTIVFLMPGLPWQVTGTVFAMGSLFSIVAWKYYLKRYPTKSDRPTLNRRAEQYIGRTFILSEAIVNNRGKIIVEDSTWRVEGADLPQGTNVVVTGVNGVILKVKPRS